VIHQCPRCPLRFDLAPMLADHLITDHGADPAATDALQPPAQRIGQAGPTGAGDRAREDDRRDGREEDG
jgi:hypothetical protein